MPKEQIFDLLKERVLNLDEAGVMEAAKEAIDKGVWP